MFNERERMRRKASMLYDAPSKASHGVALGVSGRFSTVPPMEPRARAGSFVRQLSGYMAFEPAPLPPQPPIRLEGTLALLHSAADQALGRLDGVSGILPNPDLFVA